MDRESKEQAVAALRLLSWCLREMRERDLAATQIEQADMVCEAPATYEAEQGVRWKYQRPAVLSRVRRALPRRP